MKTAATTGLTRVTSDELKGLLRAIYHGRLSFPLRRSDLLLLGMNRLAEEATPIIGLDERAVRTVLALILAERRATKG